MTGKSFNRLIITFFMLMLGLGYSQTRKVETDTLKARAAFKIKLSGTWYNRSSFFGYLNGSNQVGLSGIADNSINSAKIIDASITNADIVDPFVFIAAGDGLGITFSTINLGQSTTMKVHTDDSTITVTNDTLHVVGGTISANLDSVRLKNAKDTLVIHENDANSQRWIIDNPTKPYYSYENRTIQGQQGLGFPKVSTLQTQFSPKNTTWKKPRSLATDYLEHTITVSNGDADSLFKDAPSRGLLVPNFRWLPDTTGTGIAGQYVEIDFDQEFELDDFQIVMPPGLYAFQLYIKDKNDSLMLASDTRHFDLRLPDSTYELGAGYDPEADEAADADITDFYNRADSMLLRFDNVTKQYLGPDNSSEANPIYMYTIGDAWKPGILHISGPHSEITTAYVVLKAAEYYAENQDSVWVKNLLETHRLCFLLAETPYNWDGSDFDATYGYDDVYGYDIWFSEWVDASRKSDYRWQSNVIRYIRDFVVNGNIIAVSEHHQSGWAPGNAMWYVSDIHTRTTKYYDKVYLAYQEYYRMLGKHTESQLDSIWDYPANGSYLYQFSSILNYFTSKYNIWTMGFENSDTQVGTIDRDDINDRIFEDILNFNYYATEKYPNLANTLGYNWNSYTGASNVGQRYQDGKIKGMKILFKNPDSSYGVSNWSIPEIWNISIWGKNLDKKPFIVQNKDVALRISFDKDTYSLADNGLEPTIGGTVTAKDTALYFDNSKGALFDAGRFTFPVTDSVVNINEGTIIVAGRLKSGVDWKNTGEEIILDFNAQQNSNNWNDRILLRKADYGGGAAYISAGLYKASGQGNSLSIPSAGFDFVAGQKVFIALIYKDAMPYLLKINDYFKYADTTAYNRAYRPDNENNYIHIGALSTSATTLNLENLILDDVLWLNHALALPELKQAQDAALIVDAGDSYFNSLSVGGDVYLKDNTPFTIDSTIISGDTLKLWRNGYSYNVINDITSATTDINPFIIENKDVAFRLSFDKSTYSLADNGLVPWVQGTVEEKDTSIYYQNRKGAVFSAGRFTYQVNDGVINDSLISIRDGTILIAGRIKAGVDWDDSGEEVIFDFNRTHNANNWTDRILLRKVDYGAISQIRFGMYLTTSQGNALAVPSGGIDFNAGQQVFIAVIYKDGMPFSTQINDNIYSADTTTYNRAYLPDNENPYLHIGASAISATSSNLSSFIVDDIVWINEVLTQSQINQAKNAAYIIDAEEKSYTYDDDHKLTTLTENYVAYVEPTDSTVIDFLDFENYRYGNRGSDATQIGTAEAPVYVDTINSVPVRHSFALHDESTTYYNYRTAEMDRFSFALPWTIIFSGAAKFDVADNTEHRILRIEGTTATNYLEIAKESNSFGNDLYVWYAQSGSYKGIYQNNPDISTNDFITVAAWGDSIPEGFIIMNHTTGTILLNNNSTGSLAAKINDTAQNTYLYPNYYYYDVFLIFNRKLSLAEIRNFVTATKIIDGGRKTFFDGVFIPGTNGAAENKLFKLTIAADTLKITEQ